MPDDSMEEFERLRGELAASRWCLAFLYRLVLGFLDDEGRKSLLGRIESINIVGGNDFTRHGADRFKEKFLEDLSKLTLNDRHHEASSDPEESKHYDLKLGIPFNFRRFQLVSDLAPSPPCAQSMSVADPECCYQRI